MVVTILNYMVWATVLLGRFEELTADKYPKLLKPFLDWHIAAVGSSFNAQCISDSPIFWKKRGDSHAFNRYRPIGHKRYETVLELDDIQTKDVGYYDCQPFSDWESARNASFYLYVDDAAHLMVGPRITRSSSVNNELAVVPCRPTAPDVEVKLLTSTRDPMPFSLDPNTENKKIYFDPRRGFLLPAHIMTASLYIYICQFSKRGVRQDMNVELFIGSQSVWHYAYLEYKPNRKTELDVDKGATVKFVAEIFTNFNPRITWYNNNNHIINTDAKYKVEHRVGESWETSLTISNVDDRDIGFYTVGSTAVDQLRFRLDVGAPRYLKLEIPRVFIENDGHFTAFCYGNYSKFYTDVSWSFRPYDCDPKQDCEEIIEPFFMYHEDGHMMEIFGAKMQKPILGNLTCSIQYQDHSTESVTKQIVVSEVGDGFGIVETLREHGTVVATCIVSKYLYSNYIFWISPNGFVIEDDVKTKTRNITLTRSETKYSYKLELKVDDFGQDSNGDYSCMAVDDSYTPSFKTYALYTTAHVPPKIIMSNMKNMTLFVQANTNFKLTCGAYGSPKPVLYWYKDYEMILPSVQKYLKLTDLKFGDSHQYSCEAFNSYGTSYVYTNLVVYHSVNFTISEGFLWAEKPLFVQESNKLAFYCYADGQSNVTWFKNGVNLKRSSRVSIMDEASLLVIFPARLEDTGLYSCKAKQGTGPWAVAISVESQQDEKKDPDGWLISGAIRDVSGLSVPTLQTL